MEPCQRCKQLGLLCDKNNDNAICTACQNRSCPCVPAGNSRTADEERIANRKILRATGARNGGGRGRGGSGRASSSHQGSGRGGFGPPPPTPGFQQLPPGWQTETDPATGRLFYVAPSGHAQWNPPGNTPAPSILPPAEVRPSAPVVETESGQILRESNQILRLVVDHLLGTSKRKRDDDDDDRMSSKTPRHLEQDNHGGGQAIVDRLDKHDFDKTMSVMARNMPHRLPPNYQGLAAQASNVPGAQTQSNNRRKRKNKNKQGNVLGQAEGGARGEPPRGRNDMMDLSSGGGRQDRNDSANLLLRGEPSRDRNRDPPAAAQPSADANGTSAGSSQQGNASSGGRRRPRGRGRNGAGRGDAAQGQGRGGASHAPQASISLSSVESATRAQPEAPQFFSKYSTAVDVEQYRKPAQQRGQLGGDGGNAKVRKDVVEEPDDYRESDLDVYGEKLQSATGDIPDTMMVDRAADDPSQEQANAAKTDVDGTEAATQLQSAGDEDEAPVHSSDDEEAEGDVIVRSPDAAAACPDDELIQYVDDEVK